MKIKSQECASSKGYAPITIPIHQVWMTWKRGGICAFKQKGYSQNYRFFLSYFSLPHTLGWAFIPLD